MVITRLQNTFLCILDFKKARKRLGKSGIRTHDLEMSEICLTKTQFLMLIFSKGRRGPWSSSIPIESLETLDFEVLVSYLRIFTKKSYKHFKIGKIFKRAAKE